MTRSLIQLTAAALAFTGMIVSAARTGGTHDAARQIAETLAIVTALVVLLGQRRRRGTRRTLHHYADRRRTDRKVATWPVSLPKTGVGTDRV